MLNKQKVENTFIYQSGALLRRTTGKRGYERPDGYVYTRMGGKSYGEHRLIFLMFNGFMPEQVDHINGVRQDNRPENLRQANHSQNCMNRKNMGASSKGCYWQSKRNKWIAQIGFKGKRITIGYFENLEDAAKAYASKSKELHKEFSRLN